MTLAEIRKLFERLARLSSAACVRAGSGFEYAVRFTDGETHTYRIIGVRSPDAIVDDISNLCLWAWNTKDYLSKRAKTLGKPGKLVEAAVNSSSDLCLCADLANSLKHGGLDKLPRSGWRPRIGAPSYTIPGHAISSITFGAFDVSVAPSNPEEVEITVPIEDQNGNELGDVLQLLQRVVSEWERIAIDVED